MKTKLLLCCLLLSVTAHAEDMPSFTTAPITQKQTIYIWPGQNDIVCLGDVCTPELIDQPTVDTRFNREHILKLRVQSLETENWKLKEYKKTYEKIILIQQDSLCKIARIVGIDDHGACTPYKFK